MQGRLVNRIKISRSTGLSGDQWLTVVGGFDEGVVAVGAALSLSAHPTAVSVSAMIISKLKVHFMMVLVKGSTLHC